IGLRLASVGYTNETAYDAVTAMVKARHKTPDLALLDISLPGGDGFTVAERLRLNAETSNVPIVFITASKQPGLRERARKLGAVGFLEKPFSADRLIKVLDEIEERKLYA
ncbi:MAG: response regulator, partial [Gammaproteobacteria bacterium]|nr:response regulator [Gammaproteobacteria bacterium]